MIEAILYGARLIATAIVYASVHREEKEPDDERHDSHDDHEYAAWIVAELMEPALDQEYGNKKVA